MTSVSWLKFRDWVGLDRGTRVVLNIAMYPIRYCAVKTDSCLKILRSAIDIEF